MIRKLLILLFFAICFAGYGQSTTQFRLPFFDNFNGFFADKWTSGKGANSIAQADAPTVNVAILDGVNAKNGAYNTTLSLRVKSDSLLSYPFILSGVTAPVHFSFMYKGGGSVAKPQTSQGDLLVLYFKKNNQWEQVWSSASGFDTSSYLKREVVVDPSFVGQDFQIMFVRSGPSEPNSANWFLTNIELVQSVTLPFFENFSYNSASSFLSTWKGYTGITVSFQTGAPSPNTAVLDGFNVKGNAYSTPDSIRVPSDSLISHPFFFDGLPNSTPLDFKFSWKGSGKLKPRPDKGDSLVLFFKKGSEWVRMWASPKTIIDSTTFAKAVVPLDSSFRTNDFQIKFVRYGSSQLNVSNWFITNFELSSVSSLPFWEDFSSEASYKSRFKPNTGVYYNSGLAINPPSTTVVSFDGLDDVGNPYGETALAIGQADSLVSVSINLDSNSVKPADSLYFSFFWQKAARGEQPDKTEGDSLVLKLYDKNGFWRSVWQAPDSLGVPQTQFHKITLKITDPMFFHPEFKFKFLNYGRLSGSFDLFHVDYIVIDTIKNSSNYNQRNLVNDTLFFSDYAISDRPTTITTPYFSVPRFHLSDPTTLTFRDSFSYNLYSLASGNGLVGIVNYSISIEKNNAVDSVVGSELKSNLVGGVNRGVKTITRPLSAYSIPREATKLITRVYVDSTGVPDRNYSFLQNDTVSLVQPFEDYYSYDDGSYERTWQNKQDNSAHAVGYNTEVGDTITHLDISFPHDGYLTSENSLSVFVWKEINGKPGDVISTRRGTMIYSTTSKDRRNPFTRYDIPPVYVTGKYFIGVKQSNGGSRSLRIGIDRNNNSMDKYWCFTEEENNWTQSGTDTVFGAIMMRPVFRGGKLSTTGAVSARRENPDDEELNVAIIPALTIFPNPSQDGILNLNAVYDRVDLTDMMGKVLFTSYATQRIELKDQKPGIYFVTAYYKGKRQVARFIYQQ